MFGISLAPSGQENTQYQNLSGTSSNAANMGLGDLSTSTDFMKGILSGDPTKIAQVLGPKIAGIQGQGTQEKLKAAQFGNRGGGTNANLQRIDDTTRGQVNNLISGLTGSSVSALASTGSGLLGMGMSGTEAAFGEANTLHDQKSAQWNDIFKSIGTIASAVASA